MATAGIALYAISKVVKVRNMNLGAGVLPSAGDVLGGIFGDVVGAFVVGLPLAVVLGRPGYPAGRGRRLRGARHRGAGQSRHLLAAHPAGPLGRVGRGLRPDGATPPAGGRPRGRRAGTAGLAAVAQSARRFVTLRAGCNLRAR